MTTAEIEKRKAPRMAATAAFVGSALEYYDFFIFASAAALVFPTLFFPSSNPLASTLIALATFGVGYVVRPIAALLFGHFGDRIGRKTMLVLTVVMMGVSTFAIGLLPTHEQIGVAAPVLLVLLRVMQGASAAGELPGAMATALEHAVENRRAFYASWTTSGVFAGAALASLVFLGISTLPAEAQLSWGWRIPFLFSAVVVLVGVLVRRRLPEPPGLRRTAPGRGDAQGAARRRDHQALEVGAPGRGVHVGGHGAVHHRLRDVLQHQGPRRLVDGDPRRHRHRASTGRRHPAALCPARRSDRPQAGLHRRGCSPVRS